MIKLTKLILEMTKVKIGTEKSLRFKINTIIYDKIISQNLNMDVFEFLQDYLDDFDDQHDEFEDDQLRELLQDVEFKIQQSSDKTKVFFMYYTPYNYSHSDIPSIDIETGDFYFYNGTNDSKGLGLIENFELQATGEELGITKSDTRLFKHYYQLYQ